MLIDNGNKNIEMKHFNEYPHDMIYPDMTQEFFNKMKNFIDNKLKDDVLLVRDSYFPLLIFRFKNEEDVIYFKLKFG